MTQPLFQPEWSFSTERLEDYLGRWYEIGRYPLIYEEGCTGATADYELIDDQTIKVTNICYQDRVPVRQDTGKARLTDVPGQFDLSFDRFGPDAPVMPYTILWTDYEQWALVGDVERDYYYILSRDRGLDLADVDFVYEQTVRLGFDPSRIIINSDVISPE